MVDTDFAGNYRSLSENKLTESETSLAIQRFVSDGSYVLSCLLRYDGVCAHAHIVTAPTSVLNFRDQK